jgi:hypothetical protein
LAVSLANASLCLNKVLEVIQVVRPDANPRPTPRTARPEVSSAELKRSLEQLGLEPCLPERPLGFYTKGQPSIPVTCNNCGGERMVTRKATDGGFGGMPFCLDCLQMNDF